MRVVLPSGSVRVAVGNQFLVGISVVAFGFQRDFVHAEHGNISAANWGVSVTPSANVTSIAAGFIFIWLPDHHKDAKTRRNTRCVLAASRLNLLQLGCAPEVLLGFTLFSLTRKRGAQVKMRYGKLGAQLDCPPVVTNRVLSLSRNG